MRSFFAELRRRNVLRAGAFYAASAWLLVQVATQVFPFFHVPEWVVRWIVVAAIVGFPFALAFAWFYEITPEGLKLESRVDPGESIARQTGRAIDRWIIAVLAAAVVLLLANTFVLHKNSGDTAAAPIAEKSIAVLPLSNEGGNAEEEYFSDGLSEDLITALSQFSGLKVISRNSSFQFRNSRDGSKAIGEKLGVAHLLEGSVRRAGDEVRINAALVRAADGSTAWSERYDRPYKDLFKLQDDITNAVATSLKARLLADEGAVVQSDRPPGGNLDAYTAYLQGKSDFDRQTWADVRTSIERFDAAIAIDPDYAQAYASKAKAWTSVAAVFSGSADETHQAYVDARTAVNTALKLDANLAEAHLARGRLILWADFDWPGADAEYRRALQLAPNDAIAKSALSQVRATLGHLDEALDLVRQVLAVDALNADHYEWLSMYSAALGDLDEAERAARKQIALRPSIEYGYSQLCSVLVLRGDAAGALEAANGSPPGIWREMAVTLALQIGNDRAAADEALKGLIEHQATNAALQIAEIYAVRKEPDRVFEWLDRAWANRDPGVGQLLYDALLLPYKNDPRFAAFCRKVGLPVPGGESAAATRAASHVSLP
jgi:TolB-like protein/Tfp pilus assembly protein PilF